MRQITQYWRQFRTPLLAGLVFAYSLIALSMIIEGDGRGLFNTTLVFSPVLVFIPTYLQVKYNALTHPKAFLAGERGARLLQQRRVQEAIPFLQQATQLNPDLAIHHHNLGLAYFTLGRWQSALFCFDAAIQRDPRSHPTYTMRANIHLMHQRLDDALADATSAIHIKPNYVLAYALRGVIHQQRGDNDSAIIDFETCIRREPTFVEAYLNLGTAYANRGERQHAIALYTQAINIDPQYGLAYNHRAFERARHGDLSAALQDADQSVRIMANHPAPYGTRGMVYFLMNRYAQSVNDFQQSRRIQASYHFATAGLAAAYHALGNTVNVEEALRLWRSLIDANTKFTDLEWVQRELSLPDPIIDQARQIIHTIEVDSLSS